MRDDPAYDRSKVALPALQRAKIEIALIGALTENTATDNLQ